VAQDGSRNGTGRDTQVAPNSRTHPIRRRPGSPYQIPKDIPTRYTTAPIAHAM
jgi:hypothetical protein